jgi:EmrB/QacA subfamily drug resistance transporter
MVAVVLASSMAFIDATALNVVFPSLQRSLGASGAELFWVLNAYLLMLAALTLIGGVLGDRLGRKRVYMVGIVIFLIGSIACGCSTTTVMLIIWRIVQGAGGALMIPGSLTLLSVLIAEEERGKAIGTWSAYTTVITVGGPILGGALADAGLWRGIFFVNVPLGLIALIILWRKVPESKAPAAQGAADGGGACQSLDFKGAAAVALGLALLTFGCLRIPAVGWRDWSVLASVAAGAVLLVVFVWIEHHSKDPMVPLSLFRNPVFSGVNLLTFFLYSGFGAALLFLALDMVQVQGYNQLQAGLSFLPFTFLLIALSRYAGKWADLHGPRILLIAGPVTVGVGMILLSMVGRVHRLSDYWFSFFPGIVLFGLGLALTVAPLTATVMGAVGRQYSGVASGVNNALSRVAGVFANAIFGALAVILFTGVVERKIDGLGLDARDRQEVMAEAAKLGDAKVPEDVRRGSGPYGLNGEGGAGKPEGGAVKAWASGGDGGVAAEVDAAYKDGFIDVYQIILRIAAGMAFLGALMGFIFVKKGRVE